MAHFDTAARILDSKKDIVALWLQRVRSLLPGAALASEPKIMDHVSELIDELISVLKDHDKKGLSKRAAELGRIHGEQRSTLAGYSLTQVMRDYNQLRKAIFELIEMQNPIEAEDRNDILEFFNCAVRGAADQYISIQEGLREQFIALLTHDLRNPLTAISTNAQLILRRPESSRLCAQKIINSVVRMKQMILNLLDSHQIRSGRELPPIQITECDIASIIHEALEELSCVYGNRFRLQGVRSIKGHWSCDGLRRCIENLANNAVKYGTPETPITLTVEQSENEIRVSVHNLGDPLPEREQSQIFNPFFRSQAALSSGKTGWGLGLLVVRGMMDAHGGRVEVKSLASDGTTFTLIFPQDARRARRWPDLDQSA